MAELHQQVSETIKRLQGVAVREDTTEQIAQRVIDAALSKALARMNSGLDRFEAMLNKGNKTIADRVDALAEVVVESTEAPDSFAAKKSTEAVDKLANVSDSIKEQFSEMRQALVEITRVINIPHPVPFIPPQIPTDLSGVMSKLEEIALKIDEPMVAEMPEQVSRGTRIYDIKADPRTGMPTRVVARDEVA